MIVELIGELYDRRTRASMEVALERACERWPHGGKHNLRKRVAEAIIRCSKAGNTSLDGLTAAAEHAAHCRTADADQLNPRARTFGHQGHHRSHPPRLALRGKR
jgi:hypothetical protein